MVDKTTNNKLRRFRKSIVFRSFLLLAVFMVVTFGAYCDYPKIDELVRSDILFEQLTQDISLYYRNTAQGKKPPGFQLFSYSPKEDISLFSIASRVNLPYETIATLNGIEHATVIEKDKILLIPNTPGLFTPEYPDSGLGTMIKTRLKDEKGLLIRVGLGKDTPQKRLFFYPNQRFSKAELAYFLKIYFLFPVKGGRITSGFGRRTNPFSSIASFHTGIDIAAPSGTEVTASREGTVTEHGYDLVFGNYIVISHSGSYQTMYAHLKSVSVRLNRRVNSGMIIGTVGSSGLSTGPHLHFEVRWDGKAIDPLPLLPKDYR